MQRHKTSERGIGHTKTRPPSTKKGQASILPSTGTKPSNKQNTTGYASKKDIRLKTRRNPPLTGNTRYKETHHTGIPARPGTRTQGEMATNAETKKTSRTDTVREALIQRRRLPTLPHCIAVPSAQVGLTSLFGMGRGGTPLP